MIDKNKSDINTYRFVCQKLLFKTKCDEKSGGLGRKEGNWNRSAREEGGESGVCDWTA